MEIQQNQSQNVATFQSNISSQQSVNMQTNVQVQQISVRPDVLLAYRRLINKLTPDLPEGTKRSNYNATALRIFKVTDIYKQEFMTNDQVRSTFGAGLNACYIFKLKMPYDTYTHGLYLRVNGFAPRRTFDVFAQKIIDMFTCGKSISTKNVTPQIKKNISIFDYLQTLYGDDQNLLVNYAHQQDAVPFSVQMLTQHYHQELANLTQVMKRVTQTILENMVQMPSMYPNSQLYHVLQLQPDQYKAYMRMTTINEFILQLCQDAYNAALQNSSFQPNEIQQLMDPLTRRSLINQISNERIVKSVQMILQQRFQLSFVHPHPYVNLAKSDLGAQRSFDGIIFDPRFLLPLLLCSRWFAKNCMRAEQFIQNNQAHLMLYGISGAGKSFLLSILSSNIPTYRYLTTGRFQNPEILSSSMFYIEEFDTVQLTHNQYKSLLDIKAPVKVDLKNLHPENVSENVPCIISTNDEIFSVLRNIPGKKQSTGQQVNQNSVEAALRRLYIVPVKLGQYDKLHAKLPMSSKYYSEVGLFNNNFDDEPSKLSRVFNLIVTFALFQQDITGFQFDPRLQYYFTKLVSDFTMTVFGMFYATYKKKVDDILIEIEKVMIQPDINDTEYLCHFALSANNLQGMITQFLTEMTNLNTRINQSLIKEPSIPWPVRMYYLKNDQFFLSKVQCQCNDFRQFLNSEVLQFINDHSIEPFKVLEDELNHYPDLENSSSAEAPGSVNEIIHADNVSLLDHYSDVVPRPQVKLDDTLDNFILGIKRPYSIACEPTVENDRTFEGNIFKRVRSNDINDRTNE